MHVFAVNCSVSPDDVALQFSLNLFLMEGRMVARFPKCPNDDKLCLWWIIYHISAINSLQYLNNLLFLFCLLSKFNLAEYLPF